jgi:alanine racemase
MNENIKVPFLINNIKSIREILNSTKLPNKHVKFSIVVKEFYKILNYTNIPYVAHLINKNTDLVECYIFSIISNAIMARQLNITKPIALIYPITPAETIIASTYDIEVDCQNISWLKKALTFLNGKTLKVHVWYDSGLAREGLTDENELYELLKEIQKHPNIKLIGLATKFNPDTHGHYIKCNELIQMPIEIRKSYYKSLIQKQIDKFNQIVAYSRSKNLITSDTIIHAACSNEILSEIAETYYDMVRVGSLVYDSILNNFEAKAEIINIKMIPKDFCMGYYCLHEHTKKDIKVAYIKFYKILVPEYRYNGKLLTPIESGDPCGVIVDEFDNIKVGDYIDITSSNIYSL